MLETVRPTTWAFPFKSWIAGLLTSAALFSAPQAQIPQSSEAKMVETLRGRVMPPPGEPNLPNQVVVRLSALSTGFVRTILANEGGYFEFKGIPRGDFRLQVSSPGRRTVEKMVTVYQGLGRGDGTLVDIDLGGPESPDRPQGEGGKVTVQQLNIPKGAIRHLERASKASSEGRSEEAIRELHKAIEAFPDFPEAYNNLAFEYLRLERLGDATEALRKSIEIQPSENPVAYRNLGLIHLQSGQVEESIGMLEKALAQDGMDGTALKLLGRAYYRARRFKDAVESFRSALETSAADPSVRFLLAYSLFAARQLQESLSQFETFLKDHPDSPQASQATQMIERIRTALEGK